MYSLTIAITVTIIGERALFTWFPIIPLVYWGAVEWSCVVSWPRWLNRLYFLFSLALLVCALPFCMYSTHIYFLVCHNMCCLFCFSSAWPLNPSLLWNDLNSLVWAISHPWAVLSDLWPTLAVWLNTESVQHWAYSGLSSWWPSDRWCQAPTANCRQQTTALGCGIGVSLASCSSGHVHIISDVAEFVLICEQQHSCVFPGAFIPRQPWCSPPLLSPSPSFPSPFQRESGYRRQENFGIKDSCRLVLEHFWRKHQHILNFVPPNFPILVTPEDFRDTFCVAGGAFGCPCVFLCVGCKQAEKT